MKIIRTTIRPLLDGRWLRRQYVDLDKSSAEIAASIGCDRKTVDNAVRRHGIPMRRRGSHKNCRRIRKGDPNPMSGRKHSEASRRLMSEIAKAAGRVPYDPKVGPRLKGVFGRDHPNWKGGHTPERQAVYSSYVWKVAVRTVWQRDRACCRRCGMKFRRGSTSFDVHHVVSFAYAPLRTDPSNLVLLCEPCHYWIHGRENVESFFIEPIPTAA